MCHWRWITNVETEQGVALMDTDTVKEHSRRSPHESIHSKRIEYHAYYSKMMLQLTNHESKTTICISLQRVERMWWPGHSPDVNASEHAGPWMRRHVTKDPTSSCTAKQCKEQCVKEWEAMPVEIINRWVDGIPEQVRRITRHKGRTNFHG